MEFFNKAKIVRLRSHLDKFLVADEDEQTVRLSRNGSSRRAKWTVEMVEGKNHVLRLKSCSSGKYLTPSDEPFQMGLIGKKVVQDLQANKRDTSIEWEPIKEGGSVKLRAKGGKFLRANGGMPPWRNSVTHDVPLRKGTQDWVLWGVDVVDIAVLESQVSLMSNLSTASNFSSVPDIQRVRSDGDEISLVSNRSPYTSGQLASNLLESGSSKNNEGRMIYYAVVDDDGNVDGGEISFLFKGQGLEDLTVNLEEQTGLENVIVCSRNPLNGNLYPLRLALPPNNATMHIVIVPPTSKAAAKFLPAST